MILMASRKANRFTILFLVILALLLGGLTFDPALNMGGDNVEYLILARAISTGQGYTTLADPVPHPETQRTPGYALFLAFFMRLFGEELWLLKTTSLLLMVACALLAYRFLHCQRASTLLLSAFGVWLFIWNLEILALASVTGSEMLYTFLTLLALYAAIRYVGKDETVRHDRLRGPSHTWSWLLVMLLAAVAAIYVRPNGLTLIPALGMFLLLRREWRALFVGLVAGALLLLPLIQMQRQAAAQGPTYMSYMSTSEEGNDSREITGAADLARRTVRTAAAQTLNLGQLLIVRPQHLDLRPRPVIADQPPAPAAIAQPPAASPAASPRQIARHASRYVLGIVALFGFLLTWRGRGSAMHWYVLMNVILLVLTPFPRGRYLLPLLPMFAWFFAMAVMWATSLTFRLRTPGRVLLALVGLLAVGFTSVGVAQRVILNYENRGLSWHAPERYALEGADFVNYAAATEWLGKHTPEDAVVAARKPYSVYWVTGRRATWGPLWIEQPDKLWQSLLDLNRHGPVYILQDGFRDRFHGDITRRNLVPALAAHPQELVPVFRPLQPETVIWQMVLPPAEPAP